MLAGDGPTFCDVNSCVFFFVLFEHGSIIFIQASSDP